MGNENDYFVFLFKAICFGLYAISGGSLKEIRFPLSVILLKVTEHSKHNTGMGKRYMVFLLGLFCNWYVKLDTLIFHCYNEIVVPRSTVVRTVTVTWCKYTESQFRRQSANAQRSHTHSSKTFCSWIARYINANSNNTPDIIQLI